MYRKWSMKFAFGSVFQDKFEALKDCQNQFCTPRTQASFPNMLCFCRVPSGLVAPQLCTAQCCRLNTDPNDHSTEISTHQLTHNISDCLRSHLDLMRMSCIFIFGCLRVYITAFVGNNGHMQYSNTSIESLNHHQPGHKCR